MRGGGGECWMGMVMEKVKEAGIARQRMGKRGVMRSVRKGKVGFEN